MLSTFIAYLILSVWMILGVIYFCEFITDPVETGSMKEAIKTETFRTLYWLVICFILIVALWPLYLLLKNVLR